MEPKVALLFGVCLAFASLPVLALASNLLTAALGCWRCCHTCSSTPR